MKKRKKILNELEKLQELQKIKLDIQKLQREEEQLIQKIRQAQIKLSQSIASGNNAKYTIDKINILEKKIRDIQISLQEKQQEPETTEQAPVVNKIATDKKIALSLIYLRQVKQLSKGTKLILFLCVGIFFTFSWKFPQINLSTLPLCCLLYSAF